MARYHSHQLYTYRLPYHKPVRWSDIVENEAEFVALAITLDSGHTGWAEITVKPTWNGATVRLLQAGLEEILIPRLHHLEFSTPGEIHAALASIPENQAAKALLDNALWDAHAQGKGLPLWVLWGGRDHVELSWTVTRQAPLDMAREAASAIGQHGFRTLKIKGGQGLPTDVAVMREVRAAVGEQIRLYVDANGAYAMADAAEYVAMMGEAGCMVVEDPARLAPDRAFQALQRQSPVPILVDFDLTSRRDLELFLERGAQALSLKPGRFGLSFTRWMAQQADAAGLLATIGLFGESSLGTLSALQLASTLPAHALPAEVTWYLSMAEQLLAEPLVIRDGRVTLSAAVANPAQIDRSRLTPLR
ncbi:MAG: hypothetical protein M0R28_02990 [Pigmentiphaga sp.]|nr:hypothetical protein [Pigmentiphaga sp.]